MRFDGGFYNLIFQSLNSYMHPLKLLKIANKGTPNPSKNMPLWVGRALLGLVCVAALFATTVEAAKQGPRTMTPGLKIDRYALLAVKNSISDSGRSSVSAWKARGNPCFPKPWPHITCKGGRVSTIDLSNLDILGTLPNRLRNLNQLTDLNLENNRFAGEIPSGWAHRFKLRNVKSINLANNMLTGSLPNRKWNARNAFRNLETLALSQNNLSGGLPDGWLSTANTFRNLKFLDLSDNNLGLDSEGSQMAPYTQGSQYGWCLEGRTGDSGWCPATVSKARAAALEILDLSENHFEGQLPAQWAQMFPNLQFLLIQRNKFFANTDQPGILPEAWTRRTVPRAFPQLQSLVLYPGNTMICSVPELDNNLFKDINGAMSYLVEGDDEMEYDSQNPWFCPGPDSDNPPTSVAVNADPTVVLSWKAPSGNMDNLVFGYRLTLTKYNPDLEEQEPVPGWTARVVKVYGGNSAGLTGDSSGYSMSTGITAGSDETYQLEIATINMDGIKSTIANAIFPAPRCPDSGSYTCGPGPSVALGECTCASGLICNTDSDKLCRVPTDTELLLAFKATFSNVGSSKMINWNEGEDACTDWTSEGVKCEGGVVTEISLCCASITGTLPAAGYALPSTLKMLDLGINRISGTIPAAWRLPSGLTMLLLGENSLTGSIPDEFAANLPASLSRLTLNRMSLTGTIPAFPSYATGAEIILTLNNFAGSLPTGNSTWSSGRVVVKPGNDGLCGAVPAKEPEWWDSSGQISTLPSCPI